MRRLRKPREIAPEKPKKEIVIGKKSPGAHNPLAPPEVPAREDNISFERHNRVLQTEGRKPNRNAVIVEDLMD